MACSRRALLPSAASMPLLPCPNSSKPRPLTSCCKSPQALCHRLFVVHQILLVCSCPRLQQLQRSVRHMSAPPGDRRMGRGAQRSFVQRKYQLHSAFASAWHPHTYAKALSTHLSCNSGVVGAWKPQDRPATHALISGHDILESCGYRVPHVQPAGDIWRRPAT